MKKTIIRIALTITLVTATVLATAYLTYRTTMENIKPEYSAATNTLTLTVWGQADEYEVNCHE